MNEYSKKFEQYKISAYVISDRLRKERRELLDWFEKNVIDTNPVWRNKSETKQS